jgi:hypothetical protein
MRNLLKKPRSNSILALVVVLIPYSISPAFANQVIIDGFATLTYPSSVKLKKSGCQIIPVNYVTDDNLSRENTAFLVAIVPQSSKQTYGFAAWISTLTYLGEDALPPMARIGTLQVKVCRKAWIYSSSATKPTPAIKPGTYRIFFNAGNYDAVTGVLLEDRIEIIRTIKFI